MKDRAFSEHLLRQCIASHAGMIGPIGSAAVYRFMLAVAGCVTSSKEVLLKAV
jgi:hypothetical protein